MRWLIVVVWVLVIAGCGGSRTVHTYEVTDAHGNVHSNMTLVREWSYGCTEFTDRAGRTHIFKGSHHYVRFVEQIVE